MNSEKDLTEYRMMTGLRIRRERVLWGLTQEQLSDILGISPNYLGQIERGNRDLSRKMEDRLCALFHIDHNELHSLNVPLSSQLAEADYLHPTLQERDIRRLLDSCTSEELQLCGQVLRSTLLFLRNPSASPIGLTPDSPASVSPLSCCR